MYTLTNAVLVLLWALNPDRSPTSLLGTRINPDIKVQRGPCGHDLERMRLIRSPLALLCGSGWMAEPEWWCCRSTRGLRRHGHLSLLTECTGEGCKAQPASQGLGALQALASTVVHGLVENRSPAGRLSWILPIYCHFCPFCTAPVVAGGAKKRLNVHVLPSQYPHIGYYIGYKTFLICWNSLWFLMIKKWTKLNTNKKIKKKQVYFSVYPYDYFFNFS